MVRVAAGQLTDVKIHPRIADEAQEKLLHQLGVECTHLLGGNLQSVTEIAAAGQINGSQDQRLIHGQYGITVAADALLVAQGFAEGLTQSDAHILHGVVIIHPGVTLAA